MLDPRLLRERAVVENLSPGEILERMPLDPDHELWEYAASNRARVEIVEAEVVRLRERQHELITELVALRYIGQQVGKLADQVAHVSGQLETLSKRAIERPTVAGWSAWGAWAAVAVSVVALIIASLH